MAQRRRRRRDPEQLRTKGMRLALTPVERHELEQAATSQGATLSEYARELLFRRSAAVVAATRRNPEAAALLRELSRIGNNLNQISRHLNISGELRAFDDLPAVLDAHRQAMARVLDL
jgi:Bacterial mobilisation protein (MobC)